MGSTSEEYKYLEKEDDLTIAKIISFPESYPPEVVSNSKSVFNKRISNINTSNTDREKLKAYPEIFTEFKQMISKNVSKEKAMRFLVRKKIDKAFAEGLTDRSYNGMKKLEQVYESESDGYSAWHIIGIILLIAQILRFLIGFNR